MRSGRTKRDKVRAIINRQRSVKVAAAPLEKFWRRVRDELGLAETELVICFVTDAEIARMNWAFRKKRGPTDVLSFPAEKQKIRWRGAEMRSRVNVDDALKGVTTNALATKMLAGRYLGDIAISPATARRY